MVAESSIRQQICARLTLGVISLQGALLLTLWVTPTWTPPRVQFIELLWAWMHRPTFYPLVALIAAGPLMTLVAWTSPGRHRLWLVLSWLVFAVVLTQYYGDRSRVMLRTLWWVVAG